MIYTGPPQPLLILGRCFHSYIHHIFVGSHSFKSSSTLKSSSFLSTARGYISRQIVYVVLFNALPQRCPKGKEEVQPREGQPKEEAERPPREARGVCLYHQNITDIFQWLDLHGNV